MSEINVRVSPDVLKTQADSITSLIGDIEKNWNEIETLVNRSKSYWEGEASDLHVSYCQEVKNPVEEAVKRLKEHPRDLLQMAGVYEEAEQTSADEAVSLPNGILS